MSDEEQKYFERKQDEWRRQVRREKRLEALRQQEIHAVAEELHTTEDVAEEALALGFDKRTAHVLPLVPLIQMAWADGEIQSGEDARIDELAEQYGIEQDSEAHDFLELLLDERPSDTFFERVERVIHNLLEEGNQTWDGESIVDLARSVAEASGGFFGLTSPVDREEAELLEEFADQFELDGDETPPLDAGD